MSEECEVSPFRLAYNAIVEANRAFSDCLGDESEGDQVSEFVRLMDYAFAYKSLTAARLHIQSIPRYLDDIWLREILLGLRRFQYELPEPSDRHSPEFASLTQPEQFKSFLGTVRTVLERHFARHDENISKLIILLMDRDQSFKTPVTREDLVNRAMDLRDDFDERRIKGHIERAIKAQALIHEGQNKYVDMGWDNFILSRRKNRPPDKID